MTTTTHAPMLARDEAVAPSDACCLCGKPKGDRVYLCAACVADSQRRADALQPLIAELRARRLANAAAAAAPASDDPFQQWPRS